MPHTILIIDDERPIREALRRALRRESYQFLEADSGPQAMQILEAQPVDLILSDHNMPGLTGLDLFERVRPRWPETIRILLTGQADTRMAAQSVESGLIFYYVYKPWDTTNLSLLLRLGLRHQEALRENERLLSLVKAQRKIIADMEQGTS